MCEPSDIRFPSIVAFEDFQLVRIEKIQNKDTSIVVLLVEELNEKGGNFVGALFGKLIT